MTLTAEIVLHSSALPLVNIPKSFDVGEVQYVHRRRLQSNRHMYIVQIDAGAVSETDLASLSDVLETTKIGRASGKDVYRLTVELSEAMVGVFEADLDGAPMENPVISAEGWHERKVFKNYNTLEEFQTTCEDHGISVEIVSISPRPADADDATTYGLTERQHEALTLALSRGYYESPREVSTAELAEELGIAQPSMSNLLRRAERQLLASTLGAQGQASTPQQ
jgi:predicted DNA binding protein